MGLDINVLIIYVLSFMDFEEVIAKKEADFVRVRKGVGERESGPEAPLTSS